MRRIKNHISRFAPIRNILLQKHQCYIDTMCHLHISGAFNIQSSTVEVVNHIAASSGSGTLLQLSFSSFPQLRDTKSIGHDTTLLHFLADKCEEHHEAMLRFPEELEHVESASKGKTASSRQAECKRERKV